MSIWLSVVLLGALLGNSAALPSSLSKDAKKIDLLSKLLDKYEKATRNDQLWNVDGEAHPNLFGVAYLGNKIYVVQAESDEIQVYSDTLHKLQSILVDGLDDPTDLTACGQSNQLFVLEGHQQKTLWQIDPDTHQAKEFTVIERDADEAATLSCKQGNVILTTKYNSKLLVFDVKSGRVTNTITLPKTIIARHAVETNHGTFFVSHLAYKGRDNNDGVTEFDQSGSPLRTYGGQRGSNNDQLNKPTYLALLPDGGVLVADFENQRVVEIDKDLTSSNVVITTADLLSRQMGDDGDEDYPWRLSVSADGTHVCVGLGDGDIQIYDLK